MRLALHLPNDHESHGADIEIALRSLIRTMSAQHHMTPRQIADAIWSCRSSIVEMLVKGTIDRDRADEMDEVVVRLVSEQHAMLPREHEHRALIP